MTIHLDPEQERIVDMAIRAGVIRDVEEVVNAGLEAIRSRLEARSPSMAATDAGLWSKELHAWINSHSNASPLLSEEAISRESIYKSRDV